MFLPSHSVKIVRVQEPLFVHNKNINFFKAKIFLKLRDPLTIPTLYSLSDILRTFLTSHFRRRYTVRGSVKIVVVVEKWIGGRTLVWLVRSSRTSEIERGWGTGGGTQKWGQDQWHYGSGLSFECVSVSKFLNYPFQWTLSLPSRETNVSTSPGSRVISFGTLGFYLGRPFCSPPF